MSDETASRGEARAEIQRGKPPTAPPLRLPDLQGLTILVVDDNEDAIEVLSTFLKACGAETLLARSAIGALGYVDTTLKMDAVVTDISMPQMSGVEFAQKVRGHPFRNRLPVIALTGFHEEHVSSRSAFDAFLRKPVDLDELAGAIRSLARR